MEILGSGYNKGKSIKIQGHFSWEDGNLQFHFTDVDDPELNGEFVILHEEFHELIDLRDEYQNSQEEHNSEEEEEENPFANGFSYVNGLSPKRDYDNQNLVISSITFDLSEDGAVTETIKFDELVTEDNAILLAEDYLSEPVSHEYYKRVTDEDEESNHYIECKNRGELLGKYNEITSLEFSDGNLKIVSIHKAPAAEVIATGQNSNN